MAYSYSCGRPPEYLKADTAAQPQLTKFIPECARVAPSKQPVGHGGALYCKILLLIFQDSAEA